jgi:hypothetical protein
VPARPVAPNVLKVEFLWNQEGLPAANVQYVLYSGTAPTPGDCAAIANDLGTAFWTVAESLYSEQTIFEAVRVTDLTTLTGSEGTHAFNLAGTDTVNVPMPASACVLVDHTISRRYRGGHPRTYYPALSALQYSAPNHWVSGAVSQMGNAVDAFAAEASTFNEGGCVGVYVVNVSYVTGGAPRVAPVIDQITGSVVSGIIRSQRRRLTASTF